MPMMRMGANRTQGEGTAYADRYFTDPDVYAQLQQRGKEFDATQGLNQQRENFREGAFNRLMGSAGSGAFGAVGGNPAPQPSITRGPIYSQDKINQEVNAGVAGNDARYQTLMRQLGRSQAARGFGAGSPAMQAQMTQLGIANIGENARTSRELPMQYAQANADSVYRTDRLADEQWQLQDESDIRRRQQQLQSWQTLMNSLSSLA